MQTVESEPELEIFFMFEDFADIMRRMKAEVIDNAEMSSVGWNISGHDGRFPQYFPVKQKLGGEEVVVNYRNEPCTYRGETSLARGYKLLAK